MRVSTMMIVASRLRASGTRTHRALVVLFCLSLVVTHSAFATPSTTFWTPMTQDIQPFGILHIGVDNYFRLSTPVVNQNGAFPTDFTAPTIGVLPFKRIQMETGFDYFASTPHPWLFNSKIGSPEDSYFKGQPALEIEIGRAHV